MAAPSHRSTPAWVRKFGALAPTLILSGALVAFAAPSQAQELSSVDVRAGTPTSETILIRGKTATVVRRDVHRAAARVCRNAFTNHELPLFDVDWCQDAAADKALSRYRVIVRQNRLAGGDYASLSTQIVLSAR